jgi:imidazolonepropionase-like amidohydrolase
MATINGAEALGIANTRGTLEADKWADLIAVPMAGHASPYEALINADQVKLTMVRGRIVYRHGI